MMKKRSTICSNKVESVLLQFFVDACATSELNYCRASIDRKKTVCTQVNAGRGL